MPDVVLQGLEILARLLEIFGASTLIIGFLLTSLRCVRQYQKQDVVTAVDDYRRALGRVLLIGLEILVAATIIKTITFDPTLEKMSLLAIIIAVRLLLSWTTVLEMSGRWPWQRPPADAAKS